MRELRWTKSFTKDVKRITKRKYQLPKLQRILDSLQKGEPLSITARPHQLQGNWAGVWECHIASDWLLIYELSDSEVRLIRTGTHADLFE
ncbi:MAG TPA: type II toxin-antitoxin system YafQ family toxin [Candidatus Paceibacterota bacterium]